jgi:hypothetical protein
MEGLFLPPDVIEHGHHHNKRCSPNDLLDAAGNVIKRLHTFLLLISFLQLSLAQTQLAPW